MKNNELFKNQGDQAYGKDWVEHLDHPNISFNVRLGF